LGSFALPPILVVLATAYSLHVLADAFEASAPGLTPADAAAGVIERATAPLTIVGLTTVLGFLSFVLNDIPSIRDLGLCAALGVTLGWALALTFVPACLALLPRAPETASSGLAHRLAPPLARLAAFSIRKRRAVIAATAAI